MTNIKQFIATAGWPRIIIGLFLVSLFVAAPFVHVRIDDSINDTIVRFGMSAIMVLALVPMVQSGCGLNFGLPLGVIAGLLGATMSLEFGVHGIGGFFCAILLALPFAALFGLGYGKLLNKVKGDEMMIATYVGFSSVALMCIMWLLLPYKNPTMIWGYGGEGLRTTISLDGYWIHALDNILKIEIPFNIQTIQFPIVHSVFSPSQIEMVNLALPAGFILKIPTGMILFVLLMCAIVWGFFRTKTGTAVTAAGSNPEFARASGIDVDKMRTISVVLSTLLGAVAIIVYEQSFGFIQMYLSPLYMAFPAVAAILIGGASVHKASILNVVIGTLLFQGLLTMTPSVINSMMNTDISEVIRIIVSNGMILYALTRKMQVRS